MFSAANPGLANVLSQAIGRHIIRQWARLWRGVAWSALNVRHGRPRGRRYARWGARRRRAGAVSSADGQAQPQLLPRRIGARGLLRPRAEKPAYAGRIIIGQQRLISSPEHGRFASHARSARAGSAGPGEPSFYYPRIRIRIDILDSRPVCSQALRKLT